MGTRPYIYSQFHIGDLVTLNPESPFSHFPIFLGKSNYSNVSEMFFLGSLEGSSKNLTVKDLNQAVFIRPFG